ncbi:hydrogenase expression/formation protein HypE [Legionella sp. W05-934-2]|jgi:hydrogenase expression/formation protein HypE|uniref:hydrogenase expression/formation protein HypE n=1 Tax=Legionella sp. W05-934-2 TaxID=1198649 RepID=UPI0034634E05
MDGRHELAAVKLNLNKECITMQHGSGGRAMVQLIEQIFRPAFTNPILAQQNDGASFKVEAGRMVTTTDAHVVHPLFFPGGDIGCLSVHGTINDLAMCGAKPLYLTASFILEEGLPLADLKKIADSMGEAAKAAEVVIVAGDTKVVERGHGDGVFISTTGIGVLPVGVHLSGNQAQVGDVILLSGPIGDHGVAIMAQRNHLDFFTSLQSDTCALHDLVAHMLANSNGIRCLRDPTRGGLATTLNELAQQSQVGMCIDERLIPVRQEVASACELLGLDPLYIANEGKLVAIVAPNEAEACLSAMHQHPLGKQATIIGEVIHDSRQFVHLNTRLGGRRIVDWLAGEQLPRIC